MVQDAFVEGGEVVEFFAEEPLSDVGGCDV
jgi:hypothetical protein